MSALEPPIQRYNLSQQFLRKNVCATQQTQKNAASILFSTNKLSSPQLLNTDYVVLWVPNFGVII